MSIEDITNSKVCKFVFVVSEGDTESHFTGIIKRFLDSKMQECGDDQAITLWAEVVPSCLRSKIECKFIQTGDEVPKGYQYISTAETKDNIIFHVYVKSYLIE